MRTTMNETFSRPCLQGYGISLGGLCRQVDFHWRRGVSFGRIGLK
jgi:hypothetical protein